MILTRLFREVLHLSGYSIYQVIINVLKFEFPVYGQVYPGEDSWDGKIGFGFGQIKSKWEAVGDVTRSAWLSRCNGCLFNRCLKHPFEFVLNNQGLSRIRCRVKRRLLRRVPGCLILHTSGNMADWELLLISVVQGETL